MDIVNYHAPGFICGLKAYREFFLFRTLHPEYFYDNCNIDVLYDSFPDMIWNCGGTNLADLMPLEKVDNLLAYYNQLNLPLQLTCTNPLLEERDLYDRYCNAVIERFLQYPNNAVLVSSDLLKNYLIARFPNAKIDWSIVSTTQPENINSNFNEKIKEYNRIVLPRKYNKDFKFLTSLDKQYREKFEILCTDPCPINCPRLASHYLEYAKINLYQTDSTFCPCTTLDKNDLFHITYLKDQIQYEEFPKYLDLGFNRFKLSGRKNNLSVLHNLLKYTAKPEYQYELAFHFLAKIN